MRIAETIMLRIVAGGEVHEASVVLSRRGFEKELLARRSDLALWNRTPSALAPGLMIWTPSGRQSEAAGLAGWNPDAASDQAN